MIFSLALLAFTPTEDSLLKELMAKLERYTQKRPLEKIYLHLNRPAYMAGDTIWAQAYLTNGGNQPWELSKLIQIQLENNRGIPVKRWQLLVNDGFAPASLAIPAGLDAGLYRLTAFTQWMRNTGEMAFFNIHIPIQSQSKRKHHFEDQHDPEYLVLNPEGGNIVRKLLNRVAVRATDKEGKPAALQVKLMNSQGEEVSVFSTTSNGLGEFEFEPQYGASYFLSIPERSPIPIEGILDHGNVMRVDNSEAERITVLVQSNEPMIDAKTAEGLLVIYANGAIYYAAECLLGTKRFIANFPKKDLPGGVSQVVLFDGNGNAISQRNIFIPIPSSGFSLQSDQTTYQPRQLVKLSLDISNSALKSQSGQFSISVHKKQGQQVNKRLSIAQHLHQQFELGESMPSSASAAEIDQWMIGTRIQHLDWSQILQDSLPRPTFLAEKGPFLRGRVWRNVRPEANCKLDAFVGEHHYFYEITSDAEGFFDVPVVDYKGEATLFFVPEQDAEELTVVLDQHIGSSFLPDKKALNPQSETYWKQQAIRLEAEDDYSPRTKKESNPAQRFYRVADLVIHPDDYIPLPNMAEVFREIVPSVQVKGRPGNHQLRVVPDDGIVSFDQAPLLLIDGWPTYDPIRLFSLAPEEVDRIEVLHTYARMQRLGTVGRYGVIVVYTRNGDFNAGRQQLIFEGVPGIHEAKSFQRPVYLTKEARANKEPDLRSTAYWNPSKKLGSGGKTEIVFYLGDDQGEFEVEVQGITKEGEAFTATHSFKVSL